jgi:hypothetical protein
MTAARLARVLVLALVAAAGCRAAAEPPARNTLFTENRDERRIDVQRWDTLWAVGGSEEDSLLLRPYLVSAAGGGVYLFDAAAKRVLAFGDDGKLRWKTGRDGAGPGEFRGARDLKATPEGIFVLDPRNNRIARLGADGSWRGAVPLNEVGHAEQMAPMENGAFVLLTMKPESAFVAVDSAGKVQRRFTLPWAGFGSLDALARQGYIASEAGRWAFGFSIGNGWFGFDRTRPDGEPQPYVEHTEFPEVEVKQSGPAVSTKLTQYNACSACSMSLSGTTLNVHFGGYTGDGVKRYVDRFDVRSGKYLGTYLLPVTAQVVEAAGDRLYVLAEEPYPILLALRPRR